jgi:hypothetical protein
LNLEPVARRVRQSDPEGRPRLAVKAAGVADSLQSSHGGRNPGCDSLTTVLSISEIENVELLLTHDLQLATAARILGFEEM